MPPETLATETERPWRTHLRLVWAQAIANRTRTVAGEQRSLPWGAEVTLLCGLGVGLRETLSFVLERGPTFEEFEAWVLAINGGRIAPERLDRLDAALRGEQLPADDGSAAVLSADDLAFFDEHGYVVVRNAVAPARAAAAEAAVWAFLGMDPSDPRTWYANPHGHSIWIPLFHHPAIDENRRSPRIHRAFAQLWGRGDLWPSIDQAGFNPPEQPGWQFPGPHLHWDTSLATPIPLGLQGILYLADVAPNQGAFSCIPGFHRHIESWLAALPAGADPRRQDLDALGRIAVPGRAGDMVIWHNALPHGSSPNRATRPRIVQYITLTPSLWEREGLWK